MQAHLQMSEVADVYTCSFLAGLPRLVVYVVKVLWQSVALFVSLLVKPKTAYLLLQVRNVPDGRVNLQEIGCNFLPFLQKLTPKLLLLVRKKITEKSLVCFLEEMARKCR